MKVKIGETIYDSETEPVMVILSDFDKKNISHMAADATKYASFPDGFGSDDEMRAWMLTPNAGGNATERSEGRVDHNVMQQHGE